MQDRWVIPEKSVAPHLRILHDLPVQSPIYDNKDWDLKVVTQGESSIMKTFILPLFAAALLGMAVGCSTSSQVVRSQGPACYGGDCEYCEGEGCDHCHGGWCQHCPAYNIPRDLAYPPGTGGMPAVVQYPYYTCKGPDCFFHE